MTRWNLGTPRVFLRNLKTSAARAVAQFLGRTVGTDAESSTPERLTARVIGPLPPLRL